MDVTNKNLAGARLPAEWESHKAVWIGWPHNASDWSPKFAAIPWVFAEMVRHLASSESVRILVNDAQHEKKARKILDHACPGWRTWPVELVQQQTNRGWTRDFMPFFVHTQEGGAVVRCRFTGWARYPDHKLDDAAGKAMAAKVAGEENALQVEAVWNGDAVVLEGGAVDGNGQGALLVTEECLQDPERQVRNPGWNKKEYESFFRSHFGVERTIWLGRGIAGDDTHGHVDDFCRFVTPESVVLSREPDPADPNHTAMEENRERLEGEGLDIVRLPMPPALWFGDMRLPASYANFFIGNKVVIVPTFNALQDRDALGIIAELFPGRRVVGIHAVDLVLGLGTLHCLTHEQPLLGRFVE